MANLNLDRILDANRAYADEVARAQASGAEPLPGKPAQRLCVLTCMDCRIDPIAALGLSLGDAHILRNAGGRVTDDMLRSIVLSAYALGAREFGVIHHTRCGLAGAANDQVAAAVKEAGGPDVAGIDFLGFTDLEASVREDVEKLTGSGLLPADAATWGAVYDVDARTVTVVVPAA